MKKILLCEKNEVFKDALLQIIQRQYPGIHIRWVLTGEQCLAEAENYSQDIIIIGANIYEGDNKLHIIRELREKFPETNIILFTDYGIEEYNQEAALRGANYTISKESWTANDIQTLIKKILSQSGTPGCSKIIITDN